jgi:hypothetical protein
MSASRFLPDEIPLLFFVQVVGPRQHVAEAENAVQRRAQFVRHRRQEVVLEVIQLVQPHVGLGQFVDLAVEHAVDLPQLFLHGHQVPQHAIERLAELLELVAGANVGAPFEIAPRNRIADLLQVQHWLDNDVTHDRIGGDHGEKRRTDGGRQQNGVVPRHRLFGRGHGERDFRHADQVADLGLIVAMAFDAAFTGAHRAVVTVPRLPLFVGDDPAGLALPLGQPIERIEVGLIARAALRIVGGGPQQVPFILVEFGRLQLPRHRVDFVLKVLRFEVLPVVLKDNRRHQQPAGDDVLFVHQLGGLPTVEVEAPGDQQQQPTAEQETALPFETRLTQQTFDGTVRHAGL